MKSSPRPSSEASQTTEGPRTRSVSMLLLATALDTTWRVFAPTLAGLFLGIWLDTTFHTVPVFAIVMVALGTVTSVVLVTRQLKNVRSK